MLADPQPRARLIVPFGGREIARLEEHLRDDPGYDVSTIFEVLGSRLPVRGPSVLAAAEAWALARLLAQKIVLPLCWTVHLPEVPGTPLAVRHLSAHLTEEDALRWLPAWRDKLSVTDTYCREPVVGQHAGLSPTLLRTPGVDPNRCVLDT